MHCRPLCCPFSCRDVTLLYRGRCHPLHRHHCPQGDPPPSVSEVSVLLSPKSRRAPQPLHRPLQLEARPSLSVASQPALASWLAVISECGRANCRCHTRTTDVPSKGRLQPCPRHLFSCLCRLCGSPTSLPASHSPRLTAALLSACHGHAVATQLTFTEHLLCAGQDSKYSTNKTFSPRRAAVHPRTAEKTEARRRQPLARGPSGRSRRVSVQSRPSSSSVFCVKTIFLDSVHVLRSLIRSLTGNPAFLAWSLHGPDVPSFLGAACVPGQRRVWRTPSYDCEKAGRGVPSPGLLVRLGSQLCWAQETSRGVQICFRQHMLARVCPPARVERTFCRVHSVPGTATHVLRHPGRRCASYLTVPVIQEMFCTEAGEGPGRQNAAGAVRPLAYSPGPVVRVLHVSVPLQISTPYCVPAGISQPQLSVQCCYHVSLTFTNICLKVKLS